MNLQEFLFRCVIQNLLESALDTYFPVALDVADGEQHPFSEEHHALPMHSVARLTGQVSTEQLGNTVVLEEEGLVGQEMLELDEERRVAGETVDAEESEQTESPQRTETYSDGACCTVRWLRTTMWYPLRAYLYLPRNALIALCVGSLIFGSAHLDDNTTNYKVPNFLYALLATIAGLAYGWTWRKHDNLTASAVTHALTDWTWFTTFRA
jgi:Type II CAAX prenyl endopeptidase Rce1-like